MSERFLIFSGIYLALLRDNLVYLVQRANTGYRDGYWCLPGGHIEKDENPEEAASREGLEEAGVETVPAELTFGYALFRRGYGGRCRTYADYLFTTTHWKGEPHNAEPEKASQGAWFSFDALPEQMIEPQRHMLEEYRKGRHYSAVMENEV
jgi:8-oxo-dGTP diphosphatase